MIIAVKQILVTGTILYRRHRELIKEYHLITTTDPTMLATVGAPLTPLLLPWPRYTKCISNITYAKWSRGHLTISQARWDFGETECQATCQIKWSLYLDPRNSKALWWSQLPDKHNAQRGTSSPRLCHGMKHIWDPKRENGPEAGLCGVGCICPSGTSVSNSSSQSRFPLALPMLAQPVCAACVISKSFREKPFN